MITVYDDFTGWHGNNVLALVKETYPHSVHTIDNKLGHVDWDKLKSSILSEALNKTKVFNCSFGAGQSTSHNQDLAFLAPKLKDAYLKGMVVVFSGGNSPTGQPHSASTATSPYTIDAGGGEIVNGTPTVSPFSQYHPAFIEYHINGYGFGSGGTSYSAPRLSATIGNLIHNHGSLSQCEIRSALTQNCTFFEYNGMWLRYLDTAHKHASYGVTNKLRIQALYRIFMQRHPDQSGYEYWLGQLNSGKSIEEIARPFKASPEYTQNKQPLVPVMELAQSMYHLWLGREADDAGCCYWAEQIISNNFVSVAQRFIDGARANGETIDQRLLF